MLFDGVDFCCRIVVVSGHRFHLPPLWGWGWGRCRSCVFWVLCDSWQMCLCVGSCANRAYLHLHAGHCYFIHVCVGALVESPCSGLPAELVCQVGERGTFFCVNNPMCPCSALSACLGCSAWCGHAPWWHSCLSPEHPHRLEGNSESVSFPMESCLFPPFPLRVMCWLPCKVTCFRLLPPGRERRSPYLLPLPPRGVQHPHLQTYGCVDLPDICCVVKMSSVGLWMSFLLCLSGERLREELTLPWCWFTSLCLFLNYYLSAQIHSAISWFGYWGWNFANYSFYLPRGVHLLLLHKTGVLLTDAH